jgi:hypothetical protein
MINGAFIASGLSWSGLIQTVFTSDVLHAKTRVHQINMVVFPGLHIINLLVTLITDMYVHPPSNL